MSRASEADIRAAACHIGGDRDGPESTGFGNDLRFRMIIGCVEHPTRNSDFHKFASKYFALFNARSANQDRTSTQMLGPDLLHQGGEFRFLCGKDQVRMVNANAREVGRNDDNLQPVKLVQLVGSLAGGSRHPRQTGVVFDKMMKRDRIQNPALRLNSYTFFRFQSRLQSARPLPILSDSTGELVDQFDGIMAHQIVDISLEQDIGLQRKVDSCQQMHVRFAVQF